MIWRDLSISAAVPEDRLAAALARALHVDRSDVVIADSIERIGAEAVFCLKSTVIGGDFDCVLSIYLPAEPTDSDVTISRISTELGTSVLAADDSTNDPYAMRLFDPGQKPRPVRMLVAEMDMGRYMIDSIGAGNLNHPNPVELQSVRAPATCPRQGYWFTPARARSRRLFTAGESMPEISGDYGATIWQWDEKQ